MTSFTIFSLSRDCCVRGDDDHRQARSDGDRESVERNTRKFTGTEVIEAEYSAEHDDARLTDTEQELGDDDRDEKERDTDCDCGEHSLLHLRPPSRKICRMQIT